MSSEPGGGNPVGSEPGDRDPVGSEPGDRDPMGSEAADRGDDADPPAGRPGPDDLLHRLDPERAATRAEGGVPAAETSRPTVLGPKVVDTRRYRWMLGIFALVLVAVVSVYQFATNGVGTTGIPAGKKLPYFSAPLAASNLSGVPNPNPPCAVAGHDPRVLNLCLLARRAPVVLSLFAAGAGAQCERQVDALQQLANRYPSGIVQFAAVAVNGSHAATAKLVRAHHWTIPVAYDSDGTVGRLYDVVACPMAELAYRGGIVKDRLIGDRWQTSAELAPRVAALVHGQAPGG